MSEARAGFRTGNGRALVPSAASMAKARAVMAKVDAELSVEMDDSVANNHSVLGPEVLMLTSTNVENFTNDLEIDRAFEEELRTIVFPEASLLASSNYLSSRDFFVAEKKSDFQINDKNAASSINFSVPVRNLARSNLFIVPKDVNITDVSALAPNTTQLSTKRQFYSPRLQEGAMTSSSIQAKQRKAHLLTPRKHSGGNFLTDGF